jgi:hypothetical protein
MFSGYHFDWKFWGGCAGLVILVIRLLWLQYLELKSRAAKLRSQLQAFATVGIAVGLCGGYFSTQLYKFSTKYVNLAYFALEDHTNGFSWSVILPWITLGLIAGWKLIQFGKVGKLLRITLGMISCCKQLLNPIP